MTLPDNNSRHPQRDMLKPALNLSNGHIDTLAATSPREIEVHIEELVLHGFTRRDARRVTDTLAAELRRLLAERGMPARWQNNPEKLIAEPTPSRKTNLTATGAQIANAIYRSDQPKRRNDQHSKRGVERL